jgi:hypothetical protein
MVKLRRGVTMKTEAPFDNAHEMKMHTSVIRHISQHLDIPEEQVAKLYEIVLKRYKSRARIKDFLIVLVGRRVENLLRKWKDKHPCPENAWRE